MQETTQITTSSMEELGGKTLLDISDHVPIVQSLKSVTKEHAGLEPPTGLSAASKRKREEDKVGDSSESPTKAAKHSFHSSPGFVSFISCIKIFRLLFLRLAVTRLLLLYVPSSLSRHASLS
jgi:hypothetical protein